MPGTLCITWTITSTVSVPPMPILTCARCNTQRAFASSGRFRLNANGKRLDAWLIYRCTVCDQTWNRAIFERRARNTVDPALLDALQRNDAALARKTAFDMTGIKRWEPGGGDAAISIVKTIAGPPAEGEDRLAISMRMPSPVRGIRSDKVLALGLGMSRSAVGKLARAGRMAFEPGATTALARPVRDRQRVWIMLDGLSNAALLLDAASGQADIALSAASAPVD
ncbi:DUF1062 domain-containing protein [Neoaquamicrobium sediminum]|uniref:DUF1062 domain-containing protein n=1 Tax=Neoaquamicrobium sediminum TaxID=1849104 RepID=UPI003BAA357D